MTPTASAPPTPNTNLDGGRPAPGQAAPPLVPETPVKAVFGSDARDSGLSLAFVKLFAGGVAGKLLGMVREVALAAAFGTGFGVGAFRAGQTATNVLTHTFTGDTLTAGFIPLCARYSREDPDRAQSLFWTLAALLGAIGLLLALVLGFGAPVLARLLVPGFPPEAQALTATMIGVMAAGTPFYVLSALFSYMEIAHGRYLIASLRAPIQNVGLIVGIGAAVALSNPVYLAAGFAAYAVLFSAFGFATLLKNGVISRPHNWVLAEALVVVREFGRLVRPLLFLPLVFQASLVVERIVASLISPKMVPALDYARFFSESGLALLAIPLGMAGLSELGRLDPAEARRSLERTIRMLLVLLVPCSLFLALHGTALISVVFGRGQFGAEAIESTSLILMGLAVGFWAQVAGYVLLKALSVRERNRDVLRITALASVAHIAVNLIFFRVLGALSLGLAIGTYGLVLLTLAVRATDVQDVVKSTLWPLMAGAALYVPVAMFINGRSPVALLAAAGFGMIYWSLFVCSVPRFRVLLMQSLARRAE